MTREHSMALNPELQNIRQQVDANSQRMQELCVGLSETQLAWRPAERKWSIAENLMHLERTAQIFFPIIDRAIEGARRDGRLSNGPFKLGFMGKLFVKYSEPPPKIRLSAPKPLRVLLEGPAADALPRFLASQEQFKVRLESANGVNIARVRITSPFASFVKMSLFALFSVFPAHERRHVWQASNVRKELPA
jgi:DinB family protein